MNAAQLAVAKSMSEADLQRTITDACEAMGLLWYHAPDPRKCPHCGFVNRLDHNAGFPDLVIVQPPFIRWWELKAQRGRVSADQQQWLDDVVGCDCMDSRTIKPVDLDDALSALTEGRTL